MELYKSNLGKTTSRVLSMLKFKEPLHRDILSFTESQEGQVKNKSGRHIVYTCPAGLLSIGIGREVETFGLSDEEVYYLFNNDIDRVKVELSKALPWSEIIDDVRRDALLALLFQLGLPRLLLFKKMLKALEMGDFITAASELLDSKLAKVDSPQRAMILADIMETGVWHD